MMRPFPSVAVVSGVDGRAHYHHRADRHSITLCGIGVCRQLAPLDEPGYEGCSTCLKAWVEILEGWLSQCEPAEETGKAEPSSPEISSRISVPLEHIVIKRSELEALLRGRRREPLSSYERERLARHVGRIIAEVPNLDRITIDLRSARIEAG